MKILKQFVKCQSGATAIEYGLIASLIAVGIIGTVTMVGTDVSNTFGKISTSIQR